jgi:hypothetical protein
MTLLLSTLPTSGDGDVAQRVIRRVDATEAASSPRVDLRMIDRVAAVSERVMALTNLGAHWAGPGSQPISVSVAGRVIEAYGFLARVGFAVPAVVPAIDGSVQLEWHTQKLDLEVDVSEDVVDVYMETPQTGPFESVDISDARSLHHVALILAKAL